MKGITLEADTVVVLALDGSLVYVESLEATYAGVVALPEQPDSEKKGVFIPGRVGAKKISPFSAAEREVVRTSLSERNQDFINTYRQLREQYGQGHIARSPEEQAVIDAKEAKRAANYSKSKSTTKCAQCGEQRGHPTHPGDHEFVLPQSGADGSGDASATGATTKAARTRTRKDRKPAAATVPTAPTRYTLKAGYSLDEAKAQPRGEKYSDGNRSFRVIKALESLASHAGTLEEVVTALGADGGKPMKNAEKVARRTLNQCTTPAFGSIVSRDGDAPTDEADDSDE